MQDANDTKHACLAQNRKKAEIANEWVRSPNSNRAMPRQNDNQCNAIWAHSHANCSKIAEFQKRNFHDDRWTVKQHLSDCHCYFNDNLVANCAVEHLDPKIDQLFNHWLKMRGNALCKFTYVFRTFAGIALQDNQGNETCKVFLKQWINSRNLLW